MRLIRQLFVPAVLLLLAGCCGTYCSYPHSSGNIFVRVKTSNIEAWKSTFISHKESYRKKGFLAYSLHKDLSDPQLLIVTFKCSDLKKAVRFIQTPAGDFNIKDPWAGVDVMERQYDGKLAKAPAGIVIVRHQVKDFKFWLECFTHANAGKHSHPNRGYVPSNRSVHRMPGKPEAALVVHEASDVRKAPTFMSDPNMKGRMEASGVIGDPEIWYGINLEKGVF